MANKLWLRIIMTVLVSGITFIGCTARGLNGTWVDEHGLREVKFSDDILVFSFNGYVQETGTVIGKTLSITPIGSNESYTCPYAVKGNTLTIAYDDGPLSFTRKEKNNLKYGIDDIASIVIALTKDRVAALGYGQAAYWLGREERNLQVLRTVADIMSAYEDITPQTRRERYDNMLSAVLARNLTFISLYTVWKPNALDGRDAANIGRAGSTPTGQYTVAFTREDGPMRARMTTDVDGAMAHINGPNSYKDMVLTPERKMVAGRDVCLLRMFVPIVNPRTNEVVGGVGAYIDISGIQASVEKTIKENPIISAMAIYDGTGFIIANIDPDKVGKNMRDVETLYGEHLNDAVKSVQRGETKQFNNYSPSLRSNVFINLTPFQIGSSDVTWTIMIAASEEYMLQNYIK